MGSSETDRIERSIVIDAPRARVWRALADAPEFGTWFGARLQGQRFAPGQRARGSITYPGYEHIFFDVVIQRMEPEKLLSWHWHPYAVEPGVDYASETPTLVTFTLEDAPGGGTLLKVVESGFDQVPPARRALAFRMNSGGWDAQVENIRGHVAKG
ncbi:vanillate O-demethylase oxidoreductase VanB [Ramlibacter sp. G-1-2-2]|uniref:Vanillate O-demethylase oxidoreductase VanB n=1 Tax=Ramlibacter agri TaxID=2728837 RepID=A0A848H2D6_9BURK|nr:SRPBCC family protein [Ramlibacter agri]NML44985.1 vanillate O-demethylase oxidoreductase VanB [Ramlibacter agri]